MISPWLAWSLTIAGFIGLSIGAYLLGHHRGYLHGLVARLASTPAEPWRPPTEAEFLHEMLKSERLKPDQPQKYRREP